MIILYCRPQDVLHPPRIKTKQDYQRLLHESYQYIIKLLIDGEAEEERKKAEMERTRQKRKLIGNVKKVQGANVLKSLNPF